MKAQGDGRGAAIQYVEAGGQPGAETSGPLAAYPGGDAVPVAAVCARSVPTASGRTQSTPIIRSGLLTADADIVAFAGARRQRADYMAGNLLRQRSQPRTSPKRSIDLALSKNDCSRSTGQWREYRGRASVGPLRRSRNKKTLPFLEEGFSIL